ncbi:MAG: leucine-rich repeat domain-containing protein [Spirochaetales bacterium]|nr:leucine-rich repeat domain-containing protein [Calditrichota bacterium]MBN2657175.1 leucine-rich repeat domain-containing protein [Spirochaetales bacterium]
MEFKHIGKIVFLILLVSSALMSCGNPAGQTGGTENSTLAISFADNTVFYRNDIPEYHLDRITVTRTFPDGRIEHLRPVAENFTAFNTTGTGPTDLELTFENARVSETVFIHDDNLEYAPNPSGITITGFPEIAEEMVVPSHFKGLKVTELDWPCFYDNRTIRTVSLPDTLTRLGAVFENSSVESLVIPDSVTELDPGIFAGTELQSLVLGQSLESIPWGAFDGSGIRQLVIPSNIKVIEFNSFRGAVELADVQFSPGLETIGGSAFTYCAIENLVLPAGLKKIGPGAFSYNEFRNISVPGSVTEIGDGAFLLKKPDAEVTIPDEFNSPDELERIFGYIPYMVNGSVVNGALFSEDDRDRFALWSNLRMAEYTAQKGGYFMSSIKMDSRFLEVQLFWNDLSSVSWEVVKDGGDYVLNIYENDSLVLRETSGVSIADVLK